MSDPLKTPAPKNPLARTRQPLLPPAARSRGAHILTQAAAEGRFALARCSGCGHFAYPVREACPVCLSDHIVLTDAANGGIVLSATRADVPADNYFRERAPWHVGLVRLDCGPTVLSFLNPSCAADDRVALSLMLDRAGQAVFYAAPQGGRHDMTEDPQYRALTCDPRHRRVFITDGRHPAAMPLVEALLRAGARAIYLGLSDEWKPFAERAAFEALPGVTLMPLDLTSEASVGDAARDYAARTEILINTSDYLRPGGLLSPGQINQTRQAFEMLVFGQMRLAEALAPAMIARGADGEAGATAWVNLLSVFAEASPPDLAGYGAAQAAALATARSLRAELSAGGVRLVNVFAGPTDDEWYQAWPQPKLSQKAVAAAIVDALKRGLEDVHVGDVARDLHARHRANPKALERELGGHRG